MRERTQEQIENAYRTMATEAKYRPTAPSDGFGHIVVPDDELDLDAEARDYALRWWSEEDDGRFDIGSADFTTRKAMIFAVEAARLMAGGASNERHAAKLLRLALEEIEGVIAEEGDSNV